MTTQDVIAHWRKGAKDALEAATLLAKDGKHELALFHCHLAAEKAFEAAVMRATGEPHPKVHNLSRLALLLRDDWSADDRTLLTTLSEFAVVARYDDPAWAERFATAENARLWIRRTSAFRPRPMRRAEGLRIARRFRDTLVAGGYPVHRVVVFGSVARDEATADSDLDVAVVCEPFAPSRQEENIALRQVCWDVDVRIEPLCLHPDDFGTPYFALPREVDREGVEV